MRQDGCLKLMLHKLLNVSEVKFRIQHLLLSVNNQRMVLYNRDIMEGEQLQVNVENNVAEEASNGFKKNTEITTGNGGVVIGKDIKEDKTVQDKVCPDNIYLDDLVDDDTLAEKTLLQAPCQEICKEDAVNELLDYILKILGVNMIKYKMNN